MAITDWPEGERPREKLLARGPEALSDAELLAIFLAILYLPYPFAVRCRLAG